MRARWLPIALLLVSLAPAAEAVQQAFLIQNSGWMEPFYSDPQSQLKPLVLAVIHAVTDPVDPLFLSVFNQSTGDHRSPQMIFSGRSDGDLADAVAHMSVATKQKNGALADTDFQEALTRTVVEQFGGRPGIVWIFTNNKNSPNNDPATATRNREFYEMLHHETAITRIVVYPLGMPVKGKMYRANGLMVYAIPYGREANMALRELLRNGRAAQVFTQPPARLKPVDRDSVRLVPHAIRNDPNVEVSLAPDGTTVVLDAAASTQQPGVAILAALENLFYPYIIDSADITASFSVADWSTSLAVLPTHIARLAPDAREEIEVDFPIPLAKIPSVWSPAALGSLGKRLEIQGMIEIALDHQRLSLSDVFRNSMAELFPGDPISEAFVPPQDVLSSRVQVPLLIRIQYPLYPMIVIGAALLAILTALGFALHYASAPRDYRITVDGETQMHRLKPLQTRELRNASGEIVAKARRGPTGVAIMDVKSGHRVEALPH